MQASGAAEKGLREAIRVAEAGGGPLVILHVVNEFYGYDTMEGTGLGADVHDRLRHKPRHIGATGRFTR